MRNDAKDTDLPRRIHGRCDSALPAASSAASSTPASDADLPGWVGDPGCNALPGSSASATAAAGAQVRRKGLSLLGPAPMVPAPHLARQPWV